MSDLRSKQESLSRHESAYAAQLGIKSEEIEQAKSKVKFRENNVQTTRELVTRMEKLASRTAHALPLRVGVKGDAHIIVPDRTLIEYAFEPSRQLHGNIKQ